MSSMCCVTLGATQNSIRVAQVCEDKILHFLANFFMN